jgi:membrane protein
MTSPIVRDGAQQTSKVSRSVAILGRRLVRATRPSRAILKTAGASPLLQIPLNVIMRISRDSLMLVAAGVAFYAMTAIFPAIAVFVSIYGLFADPSVVERQIAGYSSLLPGPSLKLLTDALQSFVTKSDSTLSVALLVSFGIALWTARAGISALMSGLNIANETIEKRSFVVQQGVCLALTFGAILFAGLALAAIALIPVAVDVLPLTASVKSILDLGRWPVLGLTICFALAVLYRFGPYREKAKWRWITLGSAIATILWLFGSGAFSYYVSRFASYDAMYGALAAPVVLLLWLWLSALVVLCGAEIDAEMEHADGQAARPLPEGAP